MRSTPPGLGYLRTEIGSGVLPASDEDIHVRQFSWGQSNPTFALRWGADGTEGLVVRKQPPGKLLKGAHDVGREYAAMTALRDTDVPVPNARLFCEDTEVLGTQCFAYIRLRAGPLLQRSVPDGRDGH